MAATVPLSASARYFVRYGVLTLGVTLTTFGLITWAARDFDLGGFWLYDNDWRLHPVHLLILGIGLTPQAIWEIFVLETIRNARSGRGARPASDQTPATADADANPGNHGKA